MIAAEPTAVFPTPLTAYPSVPGGGLLDILSARIAFEPFNLVVTGIFVIAILHTFAAARFMGLAHAVQHRYDHRARERGELLRPSVAAEILHFVGEVEVVFGLWAVVLLVTIAARHGWSTATHYVNDGVNYTEPLFVVVIMALASTRPIIALSEGALRRVAGLGGATPAAWWLAILTFGPLLGSFVTEPGAMTISALLLARQFFDLQPSARLKYATLGLLFVNVSIGGTLTHFAAPPVLMVARSWGWDTPFMMGHFGWRAALAIVAANAAYFAIFRREFTALAKVPAAPDVERADDDVNGAAGGPLTPLPAWVTVVHVLFMVWTVVNAHYPVMFLGGFLFFLGFARATAVYQSRVDLRAPLLVGFFLGG
ncbi:MAG: putative Na+/H+ antiporter, partial [Vicinamibacterales bacterium]